MVENLGLMIERDNLITTLGEKSKLLETTAKTYKSNAKKTKRHFQYRRLIMWLLVSLAIIAVIVGVILILKYWVRVF
jgi:uncharacterized membrane protein YidH (DUF202 family)